MSKIAKGYVFIVLTAIIFSTMEVALKTVTGVFAPMQITFLRFFIGGCFLLPFALKNMKSKGESFNKKDIPSFLLTGAFCVAISMVIYQMAVVYTKASVVAIIFSSNPVFVSIFAYLFLHEVLHVNHIVAAFFEIVAIIVIINPWNTTISTAGAILSVAASFAFAIYIVLGRKNSKKYSSIPLTSFTFLFGSMELLLIILLGRTNIGIKLFESIGLTIFQNVPIIKGIPSSAFPSLVYICLVNSAAGYLCQMVAVSNTSAREAGLVFFIKPIIAPMIAAVLLHEEITRAMWLGIVLMLIGSGISIIPDIIKTRKKAI